MTRRARLVWRSSLLVASVLVFAGIVAPFLSAGRFGRQIRESLQSALGRKVEINGRVSLDLFGGPGFSLRKVVIYEDPRLSLEPFAYIDSLEARISLSSLWTGRLQFSSLRLDDPSINLMKPATGAWNFEPLLVRTVVVAAPQAPPAPGLPEIQIRGGRINFKFGDTKSVFYFTDSDVDALPPSSGEDSWRLRFSGAPARTDRAAYGFGRFSGRGRWRPDARTGGEVEFFLDLDRSPLVELVTLVHGHDLGVHGQIASRAKLEGPVSGVRISGRATISDIHRWDLLPPHGEGWALNYHGRLDLIAHQLEVEAAPAGAPPPFSVRFRTSDYLSGARWGLTAALNHLPAAPLVEVARHMGVILPKGFAAEGDLEGVIGYSPASGIQGKVSAADLSLGTPDSLAIRLAGPEVTFDRSRVRLAPTSLITPNLDRATVEGQYAWTAGVLSGVLQTESMTIAELRAGAVGLLGAGSLPLLENCRTGSWEGQLRYQRQADLTGQWSGAFQITDAAVPLPGLASPVEMASARVVLREGGAVVSGIRASAGPAEFTGDYRYRPNAARPHQFHFSVASVDASRLERLFKPTLLRPQSFLSRALRLGRPNVPAWLAERHADGQLEIGSLLLGGLEFRKVRAHIRWDAAAVEISELQARLGEAPLKGSGSISLRRAVPVYRLNARCTSWSWAGGEWDGEGLLQSAGTGADLLRNLRSEGSFSGRSLALDAGNELQAVSGSYQFTLGRLGPRLQFRDLEATIGHEVYQGRGSALDDGRLDFEFTAGRKQMRLSGTLSPLQLVLQRSDGPG